jgi:hypothetical protein
MAASLKATATKDSTSREETLVRLFNGEPADTSCFASGDAVRALKPAGVCVAKLVGGLGKHHDFVINGLRGELKHSVSAKTKRADLEWRPWTDGVQFIQGQTKSKKALVFAPDYGLPLWSAWFEGHVRPFVAARVPTAAGITLDGYVSCASAMSCPAKAEAAAKELMRVLREDKVLQTELQVQWLRFEEAYMPAHPLLHGLFEAHVRDVLEEKDVWVCVNKGGAHWIEGFMVRGLTYGGVKPKPHGGVVFQYSVALQKKSGGEIRHIPIEYKLYWKNGGQAVQNLNFLVV